jgi:hypothetical protein
LVVVLIIAIVGCRLAASMRKRRKKPYGGSPSIGKTMIKLWLDGYWGRADILWKNVEFLGTNPGGNWISRCRLFQRQLLKVILNIFVMKLGVADMLSVLPLVGMAFR